MDLEQLQSLETEWKRLQPLPAELDKKLWEKLRLDWNYNSNHLEGNTLTYKETELYLLRGQTSGVHVEREYTEMKGHDLAIEIVRDLARNPEELTETDIRNLNQILLKQSFYKDAITPDGKPSRKQIIPGRYKVEPNSVLTSTGQLFKYADPMDVPARMAKLVEAIRKGAEKERLEFLATLAVTHHEFTLIHPFDDGNGRVARLVTNYALLKKGLPPIVIPSVKKTDYLKALGQADAGDPAMLADFLAEQLIWSLELGIKAAKGQSLEEPRDIEKEIALFVREKENTLRNPSRVIVYDSQKVWEESLRPMLVKLSQKSREVGKLFSQRGIGLIIDRWHNLAFNEGTTEMPKPLANARHVMIVVSLKGYKHSTHNRFDIFPHIDLKFDEHAYELSKGAFFKITKSYSTSLSAEEIDEIVNKTLKSTLRMIKSREASKNN